MDIKLKVFTYVDHCMSHLVTLPQHIQIVKSIADNFTHSSVISSIVGNGNAHNEYTADFCCLPVQNLMEVLQYLVSFEILLEDNLEQEWYARLRSRYP